MKKFLFVFILLGQVVCFALTREEACQLKIEKRNEMNIISANIANVNTTRTPEGGPYLRQTLRCKAHKCEVVKSSDAVIKYLPGHVDADVQRYVKFPNINLETEMTNMISATRAYEKAERTCL
ncbi:MAG: flagellar basal body rod C-terminal domain-containing protein [Bdellovibrionota bacterium]